MSDPVSGVETWLLIDPVQSYEEHQIVLGIFLSRRAAKAALMPMRQLGYEDCEAAYLDRPWRVTEAQHWRGGELVEVAMFCETHGWSDEAGWAELLPRWFELPMVERAQFRWCPLKHPEDGK